MGTAPSNAQVHYAAGAAPESIVAGDFTGDGRIDLAVVDLDNVAADTGSVSVLLGNGDGTFQPQVTSRWGSIPDSIVAGDFTGDGRTRPRRGGLHGDIRRSVLLGNGDGTFQPRSLTRWGVAPSRIVAGDFTSDGRLDLAVAQPG